MAQSEVKKAEFLCIDVMEYVFPQSIDMIFAFASLLHLNKDDFKTILDRIYESLVPGGIVFLSLKQRDQYSSEVVVDEYSSRIFYYYNRYIINEVNKDNFTEEFYAEQMLKEPWFTMILKKK